MKRFRSFYGSVQLGLGFVNDEKDEAYVDLVHLSSCFLGTNHLTGGTIRPGEISKSSKETKVLIVVNRNFLDFLCLEKSILNKKNIIHEG